VTETKVVLQQRLKLEGSVTKVTESLVFSGPPIQPLTMLSKLKLNNGKKIKGRCRQWF